MIDNHAMIDHDFCGQSNQNPLKDRLLPVVFVALLYVRMYNNYSNGGFNNEIRELLCSIINHL